ncbi:hypothetical protein [Homoserinibacter sp. GY 40078]|uniref:hypothetical protein n=1 Tax=Homoserinibacter sp. GY 40078 TaxID=2603275 RepID=UPI0011C8E50E|nr:hypothetical protein [Homoserinibacter sp. GY 40078]TXK19362.1 hypothetical protein FVQ89_05495 [Homoserinibacter sp. GY 40078]
MTTIEPAGQGAVDQWLVQIGDVSVSRHWVGTPAGTVPLRGSAFAVTDLTRTETRTPTWAIVLAVIGALFFLLGLLFLLVRESYVSGQLNVSVQNGSLFHVTQIPVTSQTQIADIHARVNYARQLAALSA